MSGHKRQRPRGPGPRMGGIALAAALAISAAGVLAACGGSGEKTVTVTSAGATKTSRQVVVQTASRGFDAARVFEQASPGVVTIRSIFRGRSPSSPNFHM